MTGKQRAVLSALRDAQHAHENAPVSAGQIAAACSGPWYHRSDLVSQALWLLHAQGARHAKRVRSERVEADRGRARNAPATPRPRPLTAADRSRSPPPGTAPLTTWNGRPETVGGPDRR